jgi:hypothetical protein
VTDYGKGGILGAATVLPTTSALSLFVVGHSDPIVVAGFAVLSFASFVILASFVCRYVINSRAINL